MALVPGKRSPDRHLLAGHSWFELAMTCDPSDRLHMPGSVSIHQQCTLHTCTVRSNQQAGSLHNCACPVQLVQVVHTYFLLVPLFGL